MESSDAQTEDLRKKLQLAEKSATDANAELERTKAELERALPFEKEVKEKNLLIGKLRHEAVTLNEHLTKALRFLKKGRPEDNVDRCDIIDSTRMCARLIRSIEIWLQIIFSIFWP